MVIKLFYSKLSPPSRAVHMVIKALRIKNFEYCDINILTRRYLSLELESINPQHTVPTLQDDELVLCDSHAIVCYLVNKYGKSDVLYPKDVARRALVDQRLHFDSGVLYPTVHKVIYPILFREKLGIGRDSLAAIRSAYGLMEAYLARDVWLAGYQLTVADLCCLATVSTLDHVYPVVSPNPATVSARSSSRDSDGVVTSDDGCTSDSVTGGDSGGDNYSRESEFPRLARYLDRCRMLPYYAEANQEGLDQLAGVLQERLINSQATRKKRQQTKQK